MGPHPTDGILCSHLIIMSTLHPTPAPGLFQRKRCPVRAPSSYVSTIGFCWFCCCLNFSVALVSSLSNMSSLWFLPSIAACWISFNLDLGICHLAFPLSLVSTCLNMPEPVFQPMQPRVQLPGGRDQGHVSP